VNNAGVHWPVADIDKWLITHFRKIHFFSKIRTLEDYDRMLNINLRAPFWLIRALKPLLLAATKTDSGGSVVRSNEKSENPDIPESAQSN
jgi:NAD(P)-dependent dehydrogenase (short-subunit alcohol dehydrogenase family)